MVIEVDVGYDYFVRLPVFIFLQRQAYKMHFIQARLPPIKLHTSISK